MGVPFGALFVGAGFGLLLYAVARSLEAVPRRPAPGTVRLSLTPEVAGDAVPPALPGSPAIPVRVYSNSGERVFRMNSEGTSTPVVGGRALRFVAVLGGAFTVLSVLILLRYATIFAAYNRIVAGAGELLYWPIRWPGIYSVSSAALAVPDYVFPMYLAFMGAFLLATGLLLNRPRHTRRRRWRALATVLAYIAVEVTLDAIFFTVPGETLRNLALLIRVFAGGLFLGLLAFTAFYLPPPCDVRPLVPRERSAIGRFLAICAVSVGIAVVAVLGTSALLGVVGIALVFTLLLLVPILSLVSYTLVGHVVYARALERSPRPPLSVFHPSVSIVIPAYNEEVNIAQCIRSADLAAGRYPGPVEIIVGNDGSSDGTLEIAREEIRRLEHSVGFVVDLPHGGKSNALNGALALATGDIVLRLDGDTVISEETGFGPMISHFADPRVGGVQGAIHPRQRTGWTRKLRALEVAWQHYLLRPASMGARSAEVIDGLFSAYRRRDLVSTGGWVPWNGEDTEMSIRIQRLGYLVRIEFGAIAFEDVPANYDALRKQRVRWTRGIIMANGQHYGALLGATPEFAGLGVLFWFLLWVRSGVRSLVYVYLLALFVILGVPGLIDAAILLGLAAAVRAVPIGYYLKRMGRLDILPWIPFFPIGSILKQNFRFEAFGTLGPGAAAEYV